MTRLSRVLLAAGMTCALAATAHAGRRRFAWLHDGETLPERGVELEQWISERQDEGGDEWTRIWWAPIVAVTDELELAFPIEIEHASDPSGAAATFLDTWGVDAHWRLVTSDPEHAPRVVPLVRAGVARFVAAEEWRGALALVVTADLGERVRLVAELGGVAESGGPTWGLTGGVGASFAILADGTLRAGAESVVDIVLDAPAERDPWVAAGPLVYWEHGRFWLSASALAGAGDAAPDLYARLIWAVLF